jgi:hypothetical protein
VPFRFHDADYDIRVHRPVINLTHAGEVHEIKWNAHLAEIFDMPAEVMEDYYRAYRAFMALTRDAAFHLTAEAQGGRDGRVRQSPGAARSGRVRPVDRAAASPGLLRGPGRDVVAPQGPVALTAGRGSGKRVFSRQFFT